MPSNPRERQQKRRRNMDGLEASWRDAAAEEVLELLSPPSSWEWGCSAIPGARHTKLLTEMAEHLWRILPGEAWAFLTRPLLGLRDARSLVGEVRLLLFVVPCNP